MGSSVLIQVKKSVKSAWEIMLILGDNQNHLVLWSVFENRALIFFIN